VTEDQRNITYFGERVDLPRNSVACMFQFILLVALLVVLATVRAAPQIFSPLAYGYYGAYAYPYSYGTYVYR
jgi:hypothetical protein